MKEPQNTKDELIQWSYLLVNSVSFSQDGSTKALGCRDDSISLLRFQDREVKGNFQLRLPISPLKTIFYERLLAKLDGHKCIKQIKYSPDGTKLAFLVKITLFGYEISKSRKQIGQLMLHMNVLTHLLSPDSKIIALDVIDEINEKEQLKLNGMSKVFPQFAFLHMAQLQHLTIRIALQIYRYMGCQDSKTNDHTHRVNSVSFSFDDIILLASDGNENQFVSGMIRQVNQRPDLMDIIHLYNQNIVLLMLVLYQPQAIMKDIKR